MYFYPRPPRGGRPQSRSTPAYFPVNFYPRPPRGGRHDAVRSQIVRCLISIHALREEGDGLRSLAFFKASSFLSTPSARRATSDGQPLPAALEFLSTPSARRATTISEKGAETDKFLSTPSARRATHRYCCYHDGEPISIHALREEGDGFWPKSFTCILKISIHALREEGDPVRQRIRLTGRLFLSTPSARRATGQLFVERCARHVISIHALREEGDIETQAVERLGIVISIHALREEGDLIQSANLDDAILFLSTPSARRATAERLKMSITGRHFYPRPPRGGRLLLLCCSAA